MTYNIVSSHPFHPTIERDVLPTPRKRVAYSHEYIGIEI